MGIGGKVFISGRGRDEEIGLQGMGCRGDLYGKSQRLTCAKHSLFQLAPQSMHHTRQLSPSAKLVAPLGERIYEKVENNAQREEEEQK